MFVMCGIHSACITCTKHCVHLPYYLCVPNTVLEPINLYPLFDAMMITVTKNINA